MGVLANPHLESTYTGLERRLIRLLPSFTDFAFAFPVFWLFYVLTGTVTFLSDGDTGWHLRTGQWIWAHKAVPTTDLFSFTHANEDWYAWEWLWDLLFAGIHHVGGLGAVAFVNVFLLCLVSVGLFRLVRRTSDNDLASLLCTALAMATSSIHWLARPHLFSLAFVLVFAHCLLSARRGSSKALVVLPFCMLFWVNLHGGFFLGIFMLLLAAAGEVLEAFLHAPSFPTAAAARAGRYVWCALACGAVTLINPYGWRLHAHVVHYISDGQLINQINEYKSIDFHNPLGLLFEIMLMLALPAVLWAGMKKQYGVLLSLLFWAHTALYAARNIPIFALLAAPAIAAMASDVLARLATTQRLAQPLEPIRKFSARMRPLERMGRLYVWSAALIVIVAIAVASSLPSFEGSFHSVSFPTSALAIVRGGRFSRLFTTDTWASYFVYNLYPKQPSFMDGRSDFFGPKFMDEYAHIMEARWDWESLLNQYQVDGVVLKPTVPVVAALKASQHWHLLFDDGAVVIFEHAPFVHAVAASRSAQVSPVQLDGEEKLGLTRPGPIVSSVQQPSHERRSS